MPAPANEDLAKKFGLEAVPESVKRLTQMLASRETSTDQFAKLFSQDPAMVARLLRLANPRAESEDDYNITTVEDAVQRTGMSLALLLAMSDPLVRAVHKTFQTMLAIDLKLLGVLSVDPFTTEHVLGEVSFAGKATGMVHLRLPNAAIPLIGERLLGLGPNDLSDPAIADDVIGELCNMVVGNFKSNLCDAGLTCKLNPPGITRTADFQLQCVEGGSAERHSFRAKEMEIFADLSVNPWHE